MASGAAKFVTPLQGIVVSVYPLPRALPWAVEFQPFGLAPARSARRDVDGLRNGVADGFDEYTC